MSNDSLHELPHRPLRLWPGVVAATALVAVAIGLPIVFPDAVVFDQPAGMVGVFGAMLFGAAILLWWLFFSRAPWFERLGALALMVVAVLATRPFIDESIANGFMGRMQYLFSVPVIGLALVAWAVASRRLSGGARRASMVAAIALGSGAFTLVRTGGITGDGVSDLHWRWTPTPEQRLLAQSNDDPVPARQPSSPPATAETPATPAATVTAADAKGTPASSPVAPASSSEKTPAAPIVASAVPADPNTAKTDAEWPGFRGPARDGAARGAHIDTDWADKPPVEMWRRPVGPGWSSFAVDGDLIYTQEQRGEGELVSCYRLSTGEPVWRHRDAVRFYESNGGPGPRGTPTLHNGRVYTMGATGLLNALDAGSGAVVWSRNALADTEVEIPGWGIASSPLVVDDLVIVAVSGRLAAYDVTTGERRWLGPTGGSGYSSPHLMTIDGVPQVLLLRGSRTISVAPADGKLLWENLWDPGAGFVQPALTPDGDVIITIGDAMGGFGLRRLAVSHGPAGWKVEERWTSRGLKPYFNDFVVHKGHAFGFDGNILSSIDLSDGTRKWKGGRYGNGQMLLLPDQDLLLVMAEEGDLALVSATPDKFTEVARVPALNGKTWTHPVLVGDVLLVRNAEEMAAFRISVAGR
jgi:outer membrane protein assembly factor BamB